MLTGDLYVKQEFRLHLDKATDDQMDKFLLAWNVYADQIKNVNRTQPKEIKKQLVNENFDELFQDKFNQEQFQTLKDFKDLIYEIIKMEDFEFMGGDQANGSQMEPNKGLNTSANPNLNSGSPPMKSGNFSEDIMGNSYQSAHEKDVGGIQMNSMNDFGNGSNSVKSQPANNNWGFAPAQNAFNPSNQVDEDLDDEERERVLQAEQKEEERKRNLYESMQTEEDLKKERKVNGKAELDKWATQRRKEIEQQRRQNEDQEKSYHEMIESQRKGNNPWERVVNNCEMNSSQYVGGADVSRMRQSMLTRKADITKSGGMNKNKEMI